MLAEKATEFYTMDTRTTSSGLILHSLNPALLTCLLKVYIGCELAWKNLYRDSHEWTFLVNAALVRAKVPF
jgi:hypothetical protein